MPYAQQVHSAGSLKGKGSLYFYSNPKLGEARCRGGRVDYVPSLLFSYTMPRALCYNHDTLSFLCSVYCETLYQGLPAIVGQGLFTYSKKEKHSLFTFFPYECSVKLDMLGPIPRV